MALNNFKKPKKKFCRMCRSHVVFVDYKDVELIQTYLNRLGKIAPRRTSGSCSGHQRMISNAVKRARMIALLPFVSPE
jgi:small subunit ribosomal protein S18